MTHGAQENAIDQQGRGIESYFGNLALQGFQLDFGQIKGLRFEV